MFEQARRRRAARAGRVRGRATTEAVPLVADDFRALFRIRRTNDDGRQTAYAVDVRHWQNDSSGNVKADLYLDDGRHAHCGLPVAFPVPGGTVEVRR
ncbi:hypothetical protein KBY55_18385 [Streptomyces sp. b94]|uniref:hypothetical protein n=1 Tax=Streptomyces sp. b94 TaxID=1827634 RepID=UPI001B37B728|nr:hypothetical protein [Streptomyces sp. b94]MBQ1097997.1 hypothetical protein [Streptomyces sp. b94]